MQTLKLYTTFIYGLLSHSNIFIMMHMTFVHINKMLLTQTLNKNAEEVVLPIQGEKKALPCFGYFLKNLHFFLVLIFLLNQPGGQCF
jgi:hypothetical protein